jgi:formate/nitrite transporter FocA (FNT family)
MRRVCQEQPGRRVGGLVFSLGLLLMAMAGRSVTDKAVAAIFPITAFAAAGFEHSIANMYLMPLAMLVQSGGTAAAGDGKSQAR